MNTSHTPGPYYINGPHHLQAQGHEGDARPRIIAQFTPTPQRAADEAFVTRSMNIAPKLAEALRVMLTASMELADSAGDVPEWNDGGIAHEACKTARAALAEWDAQ